MSFEGIVVAKNDVRVHYASRNIIIGNCIDSNNKKLDVLGDNNINKNTGKSFFWEAVMVGDSISKQSKSFIIRFKSGDSDWNSVRLGYELCPKE
jgi:hypothetical protein